MERAQNSVKAYVFYYSRQEDDTPPYEGFAKVRVANRGDHQRELPHPSFYEFYLPLCYDGKKFVLKKRKAFTARDVTPPSLIGRHNWEFPALAYPQREGERLDIIVERLTGGLNDPKTKLRRIRDGQVVRKRQALNLFPAPLRENAAGSDIYVTPQPLEFLIRPEDFSDYDGIKNLYLREDHIRP